MKEFEKVFTTVGVVNQRENAIKSTKHWDAATKEYTFWDTPVYDSILPISLLDFKNANYIIKPEQRPYYGAFCPELNIWPPDKEKEYINRWGSLYEFVPYEDGIPSEPVKVKVTKVLWGIAQEGSDIWLCDHFNDSPGIMQAGKTYITYSQKVLNQHSNSDPKAYYEELLVNPTKSTQKNINGESLIQESVFLENWEEVSKDFYEMIAGKKWKALIEVNNWFIKNTLPVVPTSKTKLLMSFHQGEVSLYSGRDITEEEYSSGEKVCIIPQELVAKNDINIGDKINLQFYFADYERSASQTYYPNGGLTLRFGLLNAKGLLSKSEE